MNAAHPVCRRLQSPLSRAGFTLLEILLASALCTILVTACFQAAHLNWKYRLASEASQEESRVRLGLLEDLALDLRAAIPPVVSEPADSSSAPPSDARWPQADFTEQFLKIDRNTPVRPLHFIGTPQALLLLRSAASPRFPAAGIDLGAVHQVVWWSHGGGPGAAPPRLPHAVNGTQRQRRTPLARRTDAGLMRTVWPVHAAAVPEGPTAGSAPREQTAPVERAVGAIAFRYFDGTAWRSDWDSSETLSLPVAIEVSLIPLSPSETPLRTTVNLPQTRRSAVSAKAAADPPGTTSFSLGGPPRSDGSTPHATPSDIPRS